MCQQISQAEGVTATHPRMRRYEERCVFVVCVGGGMWGDLGTG